MSVSWPPGIGGTSIFSSPVPSRYPFRSSPAQKARPVPVNTTTRTRSSICAWVSVSIRLRLIAVLMPFMRSGRLNWISAMPGSSSETS